MIFIEAIITLFIKMEARQALFISGWVKVSMDQVLEKQWRNSNRWDGNGYQ
jgi:hypothetical protein